MERKPHLFTWVVSIGLICFLMTGCGVGRMAELRQRLGLDPPMTQAALDPVLKDRLDGLYREGATALAQGDVEAAILAWRRYAADAPPALPRTRRLRGYLTLIEREAARRIARQAAALEKSAARVLTDRFHVAVMPFDNRQESARARVATPFNRAMVAMIMTDLARVPSLKILEREKLDALIAELKLQESGLVDSTTAGRVARLLGAGTVITGAVLNIPGEMGYESGRYKINTAMAEVASGRVMGAQEAEGPIQIWYRLQKEIVYELLETFGITDIPASVGRIHTKNWDAYAEFAKGLKRMEEGDFEGARQAFYQALRYDPEFTLAEEAFLDTPARPSTLAEIQAEVGSL